MTARRKLPPAARRTTRSGNKASPGKGVQRAEFVYARLREAIREGSMATGERVREVDTARRLGVSRTPVREALRRLESEGLLRHTSRGLTVTELDVQEVLELYVLRENLEGMAAALAARYASATELRTLQSIINTQRSAGDNVASLPELNRQFHAVLYHAARNRYLLQALANVRDALGLLRDTTYSVPGRPASALAEHMRVLEAVKRHDAGGAERAAKEHMRQASNARLAMMLGTARAPVGSVRSAG